MHLPATVTAAILTILVPVLSAVAGPVAELDKDTVDFGAFREGSRKTVEATFAIWNTGDRPLKVVDVRPGCGCTSVAFDSTIAPGATGTLRPTIDLTGITGDMAKVVNIVTTDPDHRHLRLTMTATITPIIDASTRYLILGPEQKTTPLVVTLSADIRKLEVSEVTFVPVNEDKGIDVPFAATPLGDSDGDGASGCSVALSYSRKLPEIRGEFRFVTNHPEKKVLVLRGRVRE